MSLCLRGEKVLACATTAKISTSPNSPPLRRSSTNPPTSAPSGSYSRMSRCGKTSPSGPASSPSTRPSGRGSRPSASPRRQPGKGTSSAAFGRWDGSPKRSGNWRWGRPSACVAPTATHSPSRSSSARISSSWPGGSRSRRCEPSSGNASTGGTSSATSLSSTGPEPKRISSTSASLRNGRSAATCAS